MDDSKMVVSGDSAQNIHALAQQIEEQIAERWQAVLTKNAKKLSDAYAQVGDNAYGTYLTLLFSPVHIALKEAGLRASPRLPGNFTISREWGTAAETDQQRWMWSTIKMASGASLGTIVTVTHHDHTQFHLPRPPQVFGLPETGKEAVVQALSRRSDDFAQAREASLEIAEYLQSLESRA